MTTLRSGFRSLLAVPVVAVVFLFGVWVAGGVVSNDFKTSMALTAAWFLLYAVVCLLVARRSRALRVAVLGTYIVTAGAVGAYLGLTTLRDRVVHERVVTAAPAAMAGRAAPEAGKVAPAAGKAAPAAVEVARARFRSHEHSTTGEAAIVRLADGRLFLTLTSFDT